MKKPKAAARAEADRLAEFDPHEVIREGIEIPRAMVLAYGDTIRRHRALGIPLVVWLDGRVQELDPNDVPIPDPMAIPPRSAR